MIQITFESLNGDYKDSIKVKESECVCAVIELIDNNFRIVTVRECRL